MEQERQRLVKADWEAYLWQKKHGGPLIDLSAISFSPADLARIEIPRTLTRIEDQTLAYCVKYWNLVNDAAFERVLFLYSRKYGAKNYDVFLAIRRGIVNKNRDDEILASVMSSLVRGYYYSIQGDIYLQRTWTILKSSLHQPVLALPAPVQVEEDAPPEKPRQSAKKPRKKAAKTPPRKEQPRKRAKTKDETAPAGKPSTRKVAAGKPMAGDVPAGVPVKKAPVRKPPARKAAAGEVKKRRRTRTSGRPTARPGGSVADRLRILSGRSYDLYQERFLAKARLVIRKTLSAGRGLFFSPPEEAEDLIYDFLRDHYADPYMNWEESAERKTLRDLGFELESLVPVIDECYKRLFATEA
jgi:hypothetical protein